MEGKRRFPRFWKPPGYERKSLSRKESGLTKATSPLPTLVDTSLAIEKLRVATEVRETLQARQGRENPELSELHGKLKDLEDYVNSRVVELIETHPAYPFFSRVKGVGGENIGKVVSAIDIEKADTISSLWKFAGFSVEGGRAPRRQKGVKLTYNSRLRTMCWRLGTNLLRAQGKFYYYYLKEKDKYYQKYEAQGVKIVAAASLPKNKQGKRYEPEGIMSEGHIHNMALRKMIKLFLACLWLVWREAEGLSTRLPYSIEYLGHNNLIDPWLMTDKIGIAKQQ